MIIKSHFHKKGFTLGLVLKQRLAASWKWPISNRENWFSAILFVSCCTASRLISHHDEALFSIEFHRLSNNLHANAENELIL